MSVQATDAERWYRERYAATPERRASFTTLFGETIRALYGPGHRRVRRAQREISEAAYALQVEIDRGECIVVGVNDYRDGGRKRPWRSCASIARSSASRSAAYRPCARAGTPPPSRRRSPPCGRRRPPMRP